MVLAAASARAGFFTGDFAPSQWTVSPAGASAVWTPPVDPTFVTVAGDPNDVNSITTFQLAPVTANYLVKLRVTFHSGGATTAELKMNAPGYPDQTVAIYPGDTTPKEYTFTMDGGDSIQFGMTANDVKNKLPASFDLELLDVQAIPEASTCIAALGLLSLCGVQAWRGFRGTNSSVPQVA